MNTPRNPILIGQAEVIDLLLPEVRTMLQRQGIYLASDSARPGFTVPLVVNADGVWSMQIDGRLDPERFHATVRIAGPFYAPGEVISAAGVECTCPSGDGSLRHPCQAHANESTPQPVAAPEIDHACAALAHLSNALDDLQYSPDQRPVPLIREAMWHVQQMQARIDASPKGDDVADTLRLLLRERDHRTDGNLMELAGRCLHLSRGDRDLIDMRGKIIERLQDSPKGGSDAPAPAAITRMLPEVPESCERPEVGPHPFTGFDVGPFFVHLDLADNEAMTVSGTDDVGDWVVTHRASGFAVQKGIPTPWRAIWLAQQLLAKSSWSGSSKDAVLATLNTSVVDEIRVLRADAMHGDCQGQIIIPQATSPEVAS